MAGRQIDAPPERIPHAHHPGRGPRVFVDGFGPPPGEQIADGRFGNSLFSFDAAFEMRALLEALVPRVERFELLDSELALNNTLRGLATLKVRVG